MQLCTWVCLVPAFSPFRCVPKSVPRDGVAGWRGPVVTGGGVGGPGRYWRWGGRVLQLSYVSLSEEPPDFSQQLHHFMVPEGYVILNCEPSTVQFDSLKIETLLVFLEVVVKSHPVV